VRVPLTLSEASAYTAWTMNATMSLVLSPRLILLVSLLALPGLPGASAT
jgi:hypothetical protein